MTLNNIYICKGLEVFQKSVREGIQGALREKGGV